MKENLIEKKSFDFELIEKSNLVMLDVMDIRKEAKEIIRILTSIVKTTREKL